MVRGVRQMPREKGTTELDEEDPKQEGGGITPDAAEIPDDRHPIGFLIPEGHPWSSEESRGESITGDPRLRCE